MSGRLREVQGREHRCLVGLGEGQRLLSSRQVRLLRKEGRAGRGRPQEGRRVRDNTLGLASNNLGDTYRHLLKDNAKAIEAHRGAYKSSNIDKRSQAAMGIAGILVGQKKFDEAIQELQRIKLDGVVAPHWRVSLLSAYASTYAGQGKRDGLHAHT